MQEAQNLEFKRMAVHNNRLEEDTLQDSNEELLEKLLLLENDHLERAAILLFHPKPERWVSNAFVKIGFFADDHANLRHHDEVHGTLFDQVFNTIEVLKLKYLKAVISYDGIVRQERFPVPLEARQVFEKLKAEGQDHSNIPWNTVIGMRNALVHDYTP